jgi:hypothetical protein
MSLEYVRSLKSFVVATFPTLETTDRFFTKFSTNICHWRPKQLLLFLSYCHCIRTYGKRLRDAEANRKSTCVFVCVCVALQYQRL